MTAMVQRSFARGVLSHSLRARADLVAYQLGLAKSLNGTIKSDGGWRNRAGLVHQREIKGSNEAILMEYVVDAGENNVIIEAGANYLRFHKNGVAVAPPTPMAWSSAINYSIGDVVIDAGVTYYCLANSFNDPPPDTDHWYAMPAGIHEVPSPWGAGILRQLSYNQHQGAVVVAEGSVQPRQIFPPLDTFPIGWRVGLVGTGFGYFASDVAVPFLVTQSGTPWVSGGAYIWYVTSIDAQTGSESYAGQVLGAQAPTTGAPITVSWAGFGSGGFNVYRADGRGTGLIGWTDQNSFIDFGVDPDVSERPPQARIEFNSMSSVFPTTVAYSKSRLFAAMVGRIYGSRLGSFFDFSKKAPLLDDGSMQISLTGKTATSVRHLLDFNGLWALTSEGEFFFRGSGGGLITPGNPNPDQYSANGASELKPVVAGDAALYVQAQGGAVREISFNAASGGRDGYNDRDLSAHAKHLLKGRKIVSWSFQKTPHEIIWMVLDDGKALSLTYVKSEQIVAWCEHDTDGAFEFTASIPEGLEHATYFIVRREINGVTKRYLERMATREITDIRDMVFLDCAITIDGRNKNPSHTLTLKDGVNWTAEELLTLESSTAFFGTSDVGGAFQIETKDAAGKRLVIDCHVASHTSSTILKVRPDKDIPVALRNVAISTWVRAIRKVDGLGHLEGKKVAILGDGGVVASPNNPDYSIFQVVGGNLVPDLDEPYGVLQIGLPYVSDLETLALENVNTETLANKKVNVNELTIFLEESRGGFAGSEFPEEGEPVTKDLEELRVEGVDYNEPPPLMTGKMTVPIVGRWTSDGKACLRQVDPLPTTVNAIVPTGYIPV